MIRYYVLSGYILIVNSTSYPLYQKLEHSTDVSVYFLKHSLLTPSWIWNTCVTLNQFPLFIVCSVELRDQFTTNELLFHYFPNPHIESQVQDMCSHAARVLLQQIQSRGELQTRPTYRECLVFLRLPLHLLL